MPLAPELLAKVVLAPPTREHGLVLIQLLLYFFCGQAVRVAGRLGAGPLPRLRARYVAPYVACGAIWYHFSAFLLLWGGAPSMLTAHLLALLPFAGLALLRPREFWNFDKRWTLLALVLLVVAFLPASYGLFQCHAQVWDEFSQWASRPRQLFLLDRLPRSTDGVAVVFPPYGLFSNLVAVWSYVLCGYEATGVATSWTFLFTILIAVHLYEVLRAVGVSKIMAAPACTLLLTTLCRHQSLLVTSMYADIYVLLGAALAVPHLFMALYRSRDSADQSEDAVLASSGLAILLFVKSSAEVSAAALIAYTVAVLLVGSIRHRPPGMGVLATRTPWVILVPALVVRACWGGFIALNGPSSSQAILEQGETLSTKVSLNPQPVFAIVRGAAEGLWQRHPYCVLICELAACWLIHVIRRRVLAGRPGLQPVLALAFWPVAVFAAMVVVYKLVPSLSTLEADRYSLAMVPGGFIYCVALFDALIRLGERETAWYARPLTCPPRGMES